MTTPVDFVTSVSAGSSVLANFQIGGATSLFNSDHNWRLQRSPATERLLQHKVAGVWTDVGEYSKDDLSGLLAGLFQAGYGRSGGAYPTKWTLQTTSSGVTLKYNSVTLLTSLGYDDVSSLRGLLTKLGFCSL